jgi:type II secretory pathway predicted ATPase ExeA
MYESFYGLQEKPFSILPDPSFLFWADTHSKALSMLEYGIVANAGISVITGEIGSGKTTLIRYLLNQLPDDVTVGLLYNVQAGLGTLLEWIMMALGQDVEGATSYVVRYQKLQRFLINEYSNGRRTVIIVDEAQNLDTKSLEELRMMSNINADKHNVLQIIISGQPELRQRLSSPELNQFAQRVTSDFHLELLRSHEVPQYINSRLFAAGATRPLFTPEACSLIFEFTRGTPRLINSLCDRCLTYGYADGADRITPELVSLVVEDRRRFGAMPPVPV